MPLSWRLAAALLLALPLAGAGAAPDSAQEPAAPGVVNLAERPNLINKHDESLLLGAGYLIKDGLIRKDGGEPLRYEELQRLLRELRAARRQTVLAEIAKIQREADSGGSDRLTPDQARRLSALMGSDWPLIPPEIRGGLNDWLADSGAHPVRAPNLRRVLDSVAAWERDLRADIPDPARDGPIPSSEGPAWNSWSPVHSLPDRRELRRRVAAMNRATYIDPETREEKRYPRRVRDALIETVRYASDEDGAAFVRTIETLKPPIYVSNEKMARAPFAGGFATWMVPGNNPQKNSPRVVLPEFTPLVRDSRPDADPDNRVPLHAYHPANYTRLGLPVPDVEALDPNVKPVDAREDRYRRMELMPDGSIRSHWKPAGVSGLLLHEVLHLDTYRVGAGAHMYTNEMRSFYAMNRMWFNRDYEEHQTGSPEYGKDWSWFRDPRAFRQDILKAYMSPEIAEVRPGEETVAGNLAEVERKLRLDPQAFADAKSAEIRHRFEEQRKGRWAFVDEQLRLGFISRPEAEAAKKRIEAETAAEEARVDPGEFPYRELLVWQRERLRRDQELEVELALTDYRWHATRGLSYTPDIQGRAQPSSLPVGAKK